MFLKYNHKERLKSYLPTKVEEKFITQIFDTVNEVFISIRSCYSREQDSRIWLFYILPPTVKFLQACTNINNSMVSLKFIRKQLPSWITITGQVTLVHAMLSNFVYKTEWLKIALQLYSEKSISL